MIRVGIYGADSDLAGELIRILLQHPEIELVSAYSPNLAGEPLNNRHFGLIGTTEIVFSDVLDISSLDALFVFPSASLPFYGHEIPEGLKLIVVEDFALPDTSRSHFGNIEVVTGLSEMYRKPLVRGARVAGVYPAAVNVSLIALYPPALHLLLNGEVKVIVSLPRLSTQGLPDEFVKEVIDKRIHEAQLSFDSLKSLEINTADSSRGIIVEIEFPSTLSTEELKKVYENIYDDHNFTFLSEVVPDVREVIGTQNCIIYPRNPSGKLVQITAVADGILRGGPGDAVHAMNLMFGLFEKTGLTLPASEAYSPLSRKDSKS